MEELNFLIYPLSHTIYIFSVLLVVVGADHLFILHLTSSTGKMEFGGLSRYDHVFAIATEV